MVEESSLGDEWVKFNQSTKKGLIVKVHFYILLVCLRTFWQAIPVLHLLIFLMF